MQDDQTTRLSQPRIQHTTAFAAPSLSEAKIMKLVGAEMT